ncbi:MAG: hypothetical protein E7081_08315 [Bacteroidales bacterium]|nr:hypothetical protein [Bacteroidales bacterium]
MKRNNSDDIQIRELLDKSLPQATRNDWFVKKTLNRLPEKRRSPVSIIEIIGYIIAILIIIGIECNIVYKFTTTGTLTLNDLVWLISLNIGLFAIIIAFFTPQFRNNFNSY